MTHLYERTMNELSGEGIQEATCWLLDFKKCIYGPPFIDKTTRSLSPRKIIFHFHFVYYFQDAKQSTRLNICRIQKEIAVFYCNVNLIKFYRYILSKNVFFNVETVT